MNYTGLSFQVWSFLFKFRIPRWALFEPRYPAGNPCLLFKLYSLPSDAVCISGWFWFAVCSDCHWLVHREEFVEWGLHSGPWDWWVHPCMGHCIMDGSCQRCQYLPVTICAFFFFSFFLVVTSFRLCFDSTNFLQAVFTTFNCSPKEQKSTWCHRAQSW